MLKFGLSDDLDDYMRDSYDIFSNNFTDALFSFMEQEFESRKNEQSNIRPSQYGVPTWKSFYQTAGKIGQTYWVVSNPIRVSQSPGVLRRDISDSEIISSFDSLDNILLIENESSAVDYAWATRHGNIYKDDVCTQSAYAQVKLTQAVEAKPKRLQAWINDEYTDEEGFPSGMNGDSAIFCIEAKRDDVEFKQAKLQVFMFNSEPNLSTPFINFSDEPENNRLLKYQKRCCIPGRVEGSFISFSFWERFNFLIIASSFIASDFEPCTSQA